MGVKDVPVRNGLDMTRSNHLSIVTELDELVFFLHLFPGYLEPT